VYGVGRLQSFANVKTAGIEQLGSENLFFPVAYEVTQLFRQLALQSCKTANVCKDSRTKEEHMTGQMLAHCRWRLNHFIFRAYSAGASRCADPAKPGRMDDQGRVIRRDEGL
jgi:hypothetical protein